MSITDFRFLVVEDHSFQRWALEKVLREIGARYIFSANDGREALEILRDMGNPIDVVISDLDMPEMDGMELIRHLGESGGHASLIVASGLDRALVKSVEIMARAYRVRLLGSVEKPITARNLAPLIELHPAVARAARPDAPLRSYDVAEMLAGLQRGEFEPFFQPKLDMVSRKVKGAEALARWRHPVEGVVGANEFIAELERSGDIAAFTTMLVKSATTTCRIWRALGCDVSLSVNLSQESLGDVELASKMTKIVLDANLEPRDVIFEVTESAMAVDLGRALENLSRLRMKGFGLSIDDYGTGYSSMQQLTRIAFTELKIDQSFVKNAADPQANRAVLESSLEMADKLRIPAVAEGVETREEWDLLRGMRCDLAQGYFIAKPMDSGDFLGWLKRNCAA